MARKPPPEDPGDSGLHVGPRKHWAAGVPAVTVALRDGWEQMGVVRTARTLRLLNQNTGFDCPGCAWPEPGRPHLAEFCENGAKAVAAEATLRRVGPDFFAEHPISSLATRSGWWLEQQGRLTTPMHKPAGSDHYLPVTWDEASRIAARHLTAMDSPNRAVFYTSGKASNEAAFTWQLFARALGTNNLPDCSNMCHESSGEALTETIGIGKGSVSHDDLALADLILVVGQNPGTNHPRMLSSLEECVRAGGQVVAINPLPEAGLIAFRNPQKPRGVLGRGTTLASQHLQIRLGGDLALFQALNRRLLDADALDHEFLAEHVEGLEELRSHLALLDADEVSAATGLAPHEIDELAQRVMRSERIIVCWAMGLTQHRDAVATIQEIVSFLLLRGNIGRPGAGVCPVRGHSNVQGDRTMGIWERMPEEFLQALGREFGFDAPRAPGLDTVDTIRAMRDGKVSVFLGLGGNFAQATPDTEVTEDAMRRCSLTVHIATKLNRGHLVTGTEALLLPCLGRTERDVQAGGEQQITVEDSMSMVHASRGPLEPASPMLRSEVAVICGLAGATLGSAGIDWAGLAADYRRIRAHVSRVVPGFADYEERLGEPGGFVLPHPPRDARVFHTPSGKARLTVNRLEVLRVPEGRLLLQTIRSHDQFNTTIYGLDDRYRGITGGRRVVFVHAQDLADRGLVDGSMVDLIGEWEGTERRAPAFRAVAYDTPRGCAAAYFPETNSLVPLDSTARRSNTPVSKAVVIRIEAATSAPSPD
jgi:molybdopterin-dependent oxidoreductase alpha subunit